ncbi:hypothetical protein Patl1_24668 [Pistacia atlantica]|uniref:Uncharacterized protein n=1 Tax=Pistacia atlantica TaxID=434234 RepID=A0ACC0ZXJ8_9ROSI|nr:hypothetical protein Patl1_24668 [Pistacia atlantica]
MMENVQVGSPQVANGVVPVPPPLPGPTTSYNQLKDGSPLRGFEKVDMEDYVLHLLVLSHVFVVRRLKRECKCSLEEGLHIMPYPNR